MQAFRSATAAAGDAATVTFSALPGKRYRVIGCEASSIGGAAGTNVSITGIDGAAGPTAAPDSFSLALVVDAVSPRFAEGLLSKENVDFVFVVEALASSVPKINVWCSTENA